MRVTIDLRHGPEGHVAGVVVGPDDAAPVPFDGWLQLLRVLAATALPVAVAPAEAPDPDTPPVT